ncbi:Golgi apparatus membrane protein TVP38 [Lentinula detonsa]|uniref:Golgi apparatus membrane protein TVP38 n=1 Tax=Lentinula detonsa TaxID=2804962 RepID=A0A9W8NUV3_9AGAR|nr:Golgi apparatus membrane protein TVP38 [Lentinula detonsa]
MMTSESSDSRFQQLARLPKYYAAQALNRYRRLGIFGKMVLFLWALINVFLVIFIIVLTPTRIFQFLYDESTKLSHTRFGFLALGAIIFLVSFPPFIGHTTTVTVCGFAYGWRIGFLIAAAASIIGSATVFCVLRLLFSSRLRQWSAKNAKFMALESVVKEKGLPLIILIRVSPFPPWVYSNSLFASIQSVALWQFVVATAFVFPKLLLHAFIGSRMAALSDGNQREEMDTSTKILNGCLVGGMNEISLCYGSN